MGLKVKYSIGTAVFFAAVLSLTLVWPGYAAEVKILDDLEKTIFTDAIKERCARHYQSSSALQSALDGLNTGDEISSMPRINKALAQVTQSEALLLKTNEELLELTGYVAANQAKITGSGIEAFLPLVKLKGDSQVRYQKSVLAYLGALKAMLEFSKANMPALRVGRKAEMDAYDVLYRAYVAAADSQGEADAAWRQHQADLGHEHPALRPCLENKFEKEEKL